MCSSECRAHEAAPDVRCASDTVEGRGFPYDHVTDERSSCLPHTVTPEFGARVRSRSHERARHRLDGLHAGAKARHCFSIPLELPVGQVADAQVGDAAERRPRELRVHVRLATDRQAPRETGASAPRRAPRARDRASARCLSRSTSCAPLRTRPQRRRSARQRCRVRARARRSTQASCGCSISRSGRPTRP